MFFHSCPRCEGAEELIDEDGWWLLHCFLCGGRRKAILRINLWGGYEIAEKDDHGAKAESEQDQKVCLPSSSANMERQSRFLLLGEELPAA